jgi:hypothetical protein
MIPWLTRISRRVHGRVGSCSGRSPAMRTGSKAGLGREYPEPKGWIVAGSIHARRLTASYFRTAG